MATKKRVISDAQLCIRLPREEYNRLRDVAQRSDRSMSGEIRRALREHVKSRETRDER